MILAPVGSAPSAASTSSSLRSPSTIRRPTQLMATLRSYVQIDRADQEPDALFAAGQRASRTATERLVRLLGGLRGARARFSGSRWQIFTSVRNCPAASASSAISASSASKEK